MRNTIDDDISEQTDKNSGDYRSNQSKIKRRDIILLFEEEASKIREQAQEYQDCAVRRDEKRAEIGSYLMILYEMQEAVTGELELEKAYIEELKQELLKTGPANSESCSGENQAEDQGSHAFEALMSVRVTRILLLSCQFDAYIGNQSGKYVRKRVHCV